jgi:hypothetical protein
MAHKKHYRLAVEGKQNSTVVGRSYATIREALADVYRVNSLRELDGQKPITVLKVSTPSGTYKHLQYVDENEEE